MEEGTFASIVWTWVGQTLAMGAAVAVVILGGMLIGLITLKGFKGIMKYINQDFYAVRETVKEEIQA